MQRSLIFLSISKSAQRFHPRLIGMCFTILAVVLLAVPSRLQAQNAEVTGSVRDDNKAMIAGATIAVVNQDTTTARTTITDSAGLYMVPALSPGHYRLTVSANGFETQSRNDIKVETGQKLQIDFAMKIGASKEVVTVNGDQTYINQSDATVSTVIDHQFVENVPLNGRSMQSLLTMVPGVVTVPGSGQVGYQGEISVDGQRTESNYFTVDGVSANSGAKIDNETGGAGYSGAVPGMTISGTTQSMVSIDDLQEFRASTSTYSADQGRTPGGQFAFTTRSGTNDWHGSLSEYFRNDALDAGNWFNGYCNAITDSNDCQSFTPFPKGAEKQNDFGGTLGGPVILPHLYNGKGKTFFFTSYEGLRLVQPVPPSTWVVPDNAMRAAAPDVLKPFLNAYAVQNGGEMTQSPGLAYYNLVYSMPSNLDSTSVRIDHSISDRFKIFGRWAYTPSSGWYFNDLPIHDNIKANVQSITVGATNVLTPTQTNEFRVNFKGNDSGEDETASNFGGATPISVGIVPGPNGNPLPPIGSQLTFRTYFTTGGKAEFEFEGNDYNQHQYNVTDTYYWTHGKHALKFGVDWRSISTYAVPSINKEEVEFASEAEVLANSASTVENVPHSILKSEPVYVNFSAFAQDEWKATSRLSLSLGLRWDVNPPPGNSIGYLPFTLNEITDIATAVLAPENTPLWQTDWHAFEPRLGFAYRLGQHTGFETVLRAGAGLYYDLGTVFTSNGFSNYMGFDTTVKYSHVPFPLTPTQMTLPAVSRTPPYTENVLAIDPHLRLPYTLHWNFAVEQGLGRNQTLTVNYVASRSQDQLAEIRYDVGGAVGSLYYNPNFASGTSADVVANRASASYDSLQVKFQRNLLHGLQALGAYTWSHSIDNASSNLTLMELLRGNSDFDLRQNFEAGITYNVPGNYSNLAESALLKHWLIDSRITARTGFPVDLSGSQVVDPVTDAELNYEPNFVAGQPLYVSSATDGVHTASAPKGRAFNINAFTEALDANGNDVNGNVPRNYMRGFGAVQFDMGLARDFPLVEKLKLQFKAEAFNVFNHPTMGAVDGTLGDGPGQFGFAQGSLNNQGGAESALYQAGGPRSLQLALKLQF